MTSWRGAINKAQSAPRDLRQRVQLRGHSFGRDLNLHPSVRFDGDGVVLGDWVRMRRDCRVQGPCIIESNCFFNVGVWVGLQTHIEEGCSIGHYARFITVDHEMGPSHHRAGAVVIKPVRVGRGAWIGAGATVLPGFTVGVGAVVAAGALVTRDVPPNTLVVGSPAKVARELPT